MRTYAERAACINTDTLATYHVMLADFERLPDMEPIDRVSCHSLCRAFAMRYENVTCIDGWFAKVGNEHSWLDMGGGVIADMYPIAGIGPFLVDASHFMVPWHHLYIPHPELLKKEARGDGRNLEHHKAVALEIYEILKKSRK